MLIIVTATVFIPSYLSYRRSLTWEVTEPEISAVLRQKVGEALRTLLNSQPRYFFWPGNGDPRSAAKAFQRWYWKLFKLANVQKPDGTSKRCHPHMFRDTFAVELLLAGVPLDQVSLLLGHSSLKITEATTRRSAKLGRNNLQLL